MVWYLIFGAGLVIVLTGLVQYLRTRQNDRTMLMLVGGIIAYVGWVGISAQLQQAHHSLQLARYRQWFFGGGGALVLAWAAYQLWRSAAVLRWPSAPGNVLSSEALPRHAAKQQYEVRVRYRYRVGNQNFESMRRTLDTEEPVDGALAAAVAGRYQQGAAVSVYYDPTNPGRACLERSWLNGAWLVPLVFGSLLVIVAWYWQQQP